MTRTAEEFSPIYPIFVPQGKSKIRYKLGYIDRNGRLLIDPVFDDGTGFHGGLAAVKVKRRWGFIDRSGTMRIEPKFSGPGYFESGVAAVPTSRGSGVIDSTGAFLLAPKFDGLNSFSEGMACFMPSECGKETRYGFINKLGETVVPAIFQRALGFSEGLAAVELDGLWGFITPPGLFEMGPSYKGLWDAQGRVVLAGASSFCEGLARVWLGSENGYIDKTGRVHFRIPFTMALQFSEGRAMVRQGEECGFIDRSGNLVIDLRFSLCHSFSDGMSSCVPRDQKLWGIINRNGEWIIEPKFLYALAIKDGLCFVETEKTIGYVNATGEFVWQGPFVQYRAFGL